MRIPNSILVIHPTAGTSNVRYEPAYYAEAYRSVWHKRLDDNRPGKGVEVLTMPEDAGEDARYSESPGADFEFRKLVTMFGENVVERLFPRGEADVSAAIERLLLADAERLDKLEKKNAAPPVKAHPAWTKLGLTDAKAIAMHIAGFPTPNDLPIDATVVSLCSAVPAITPLDARHILTK